MAPCSTSARRFIISLVIVGSLGVRVSNPTLNQNQQWLPKLHHGRGHDRGVRVIPSSRIARRIFAYNATENILRATFRKRKATYQDRYTFKPHFRTRSQRPTGTLLFRCLYMILTGASIICPLITPSPFVADLGASKMWWTTSMPSVTWPNAAQPALSSVCFGMASRPLKSPPKIKNRLAPCREHRAPSRWCHRYVTSPSESSARVRWAERSGADRRACYPASAHHQ